MTQARRYEGLDPVFDKDCKVLILGTKPGPDSIRDHFYYANKRNRFWVILDALFGDSFATADNDGKKSLLLKHHIALWDVYKSWEAKNNSPRDRDIKNPELNDLLELIRKTKIERIIIAGKKAQKAFHAKFDDGIKTLGRKITVKDASSTSPSNTHNTTEDLIQEWQGAMEL